MILTDLAIEEAVRAGRIEIDPWDPAQLNPASYDLTLGDEVVTYVLADNAVDTKHPQTTSRRKIGSEGTVVFPGVGYLMHTRERIRTDRYVSCIDGKSSLGRLFLSVHQCAGFGDPGFSGQYTLEVTSIFPVRLYAGMRIAQVRFHELSGEVGQLYRGNYVGDAATGPVPSRAWKQFK